MTTRERNLAVALVGTLGVFGVGFVAYQFVIGPLFEKGKQIQTKRDEIANLEIQVLEIQAQKRRFEAARQQSLPADVGVSRTQYGTLLEGLFRRADVTPQSSGLKVTMQDPENKSSPTIGPKKPAYTKLTYDVTFKAELYHLVDFMQHFYQQPLLHQIKNINIQRPSDARSRGQNELDVTLKIEALVLDNAPPRPTLLPVIREFALVSGAAAYTGVNMKAVTEGRGSPVAPAGILAETLREYLAIAGRNIFFGPSREPEGPRGDDDHSRFVTLTSVVGREDGSLTAVFRDKLDNNNYTVTQSPQGVVEVKGEYELNGKWKTVPGYKDKSNGRDLFYGSEEGQNLRNWRVWRITSDLAVIIEKVDADEWAPKPKPSTLALFGGGPGAVLAVPDGKMYKVTVLQTLDTRAAKEGPWRKEGGPLPPTPLSKEAAWKEIYGPRAVPASASPTPREPARTAMRTEDEGSEDK
ncbi:MAG TPA: hypothetical protein VKE40_07995 [Gemmataceae bacterium]|nr:hypothetical protein [Gemmataceae bacterium]